MPWTVLRRNRVDTARPTCDGRSRPLHDTPRNPTPGGCEPKAAERRMCGRWFLTALESVNFEECGLTG